jgi:hypothetical protein
MDTRLLKLLEEETAKERAKKKKPVFKLRKEKSVMYYSGWGKDKPIREKRERQDKLNS